MRTKTCKQSSDDVKYVIVCVFSFALFFSFALCTAFPVALSISHFYYVNTSVHNKFLYVTTMSLYENDQILPANINLFTSNY